MNRLNLGILAHVDAGKTTLTERLLHAAGVIDALGSVDAGTTQTDSMPLERERGITIRAAVAAFTVDDVAVNLIDTPGHPDFIAEVDRSLTVLDGAVLVVSAVEGVQPQTVVLMRALRRLRVPTLIFVNKIDRGGADPARVVTAISDRLGGRVIMMGTTRDAGTRTATAVGHRLDDPAFVTTLLEVLTDQDEALLRAYVNGRPDAVSTADLAAALAAQTSTGALNPIFFGSAITGVGVGELMAALTTLLPTAGGDPDAEPSGSVFKVERRPRGEKVAYVRMVDGRVSRRQRVQVGVAQDATVTAVRVFEPGGPVDREEVVAGQIATLSGLREVRVGDSIGTPPLRRTTELFAPPTLETGVVATDPAQQGALHAALAQLAEQDPLINLRQDDERGELYLSLFGEVQKEVIAQTLASDFGVAVDYHETTVICIERPVGVGHAVEVMGDPANPFAATIGLSVEPGPVGSGLEVRIAVEAIAIPLYVYKNLDEFARSLTEYVATSLGSGLLGWAVTDCVVTLTESSYQAPSTTAGDVRKLTPLVLLSALRAAGTVVCEPIHRFHLDGPLDSLSPVLQLLGRHRAVPQTPSVSERWFTVDGDVPAAEIAALQRRLPGRSHGEGVLEVIFDRYDPYPGRPPTRALGDHHPLHREQYLAHLTRRG